MSLDHGDDRRPSPDALLEAARRETPGRLKIFLGAAPGVGKTFEMLSEARAAKTAGRDVVVGVVETHGRAETEALLQGLEVLPRRPAAKGGRAFDEMDLDALIARRPELALVDELAHTNAEGSRHAKRWSDVEELLGEGVDVWTTMNIQHVESLNDIVAQITRIRVRETVPDSIIDRADDIELIDITPDDLIARLKDGKIYLPKTAERATAHYFSQGNLTALRELALRRTAQRVDAQLVTHMRANAIAGPWAAGERVMVCVQDGAQAANLVRAAKRMADRLQAPWLAVHVELPGGRRSSEQDHDGVAQALRLAERLGGEAIIQPAVRREIVDDILTLARERNVTQIMVGKPKRARWLRLFRDTVTGEIVDRSGAIGVHIVAGGETGAASSSAPALREDAATPAAFGAALLATVVALGLGLALVPWIGVETIDLLFLTAVVVVAVRFGLWPSLVAVAAGSLAYNFFFLPPTYTFTVASPTNVSALLLFTVVALVVSNLAALVNRQAAAARRRARTTEALYSFSRKLAGVTTLDDALWATAYQIASMLNVRVVLLLPEPTGERLEIEASYPPEDRLDAADLAAAKWTFENNTPAGRGADTLPGAKRLFLPLRTARGPVGVIGVDRDAPGALFNPEQKRLMDALADQAAIAIERVNLVADIAVAERAAETDRLRQALLTSISHDLRTPLSSIMGASSTLRDFRALLDDRATDELLATIGEESERLNRFIANLLDMTRLESGALEPNIGPHDVSELVGAALKRAAPVLADRRVEVELAPDLPMAKVDPVLFDHTLFNLLDNAAKYADAPAGITIRATRGRRDGVVIEVMDEGPGIPVDQLERVFDKFHRVAKADRVRAGTGLGLAICRGFVEAMGGTIVATNRADRPGAVFAVTLPGHASPGTEQ